MYTGTGSAWLSICEMQRRMQKSRREKTVKISTRRMDKAAVLDISGDIDMAHSTELRRVVLVEFRESRTPRLILNMLEVRYIDSSGVASLVEGLKASRDVGSRLILVGLSPFVQEILRLTRLLTIFEIYDTEEKALAS
jgi:anti-sigma B factor antagonist